MTATLPERDTAPALEPETGKRVDVRSWRRELAEWLREHGMGATGAAWDAAVSGERDLTTLRMTARTDGTLARHWTGTVAPAALAAGDLTDYGPVTGAPLTDPETGRVWVTTRRVKSGATDHDVVTLEATYRDHELDPAVPVHVTRGKGDI